MNEAHRLSFQQEDEQEEAHRLSFCDLPLSAATPPPPSAEPDHLFEFSATARSHFNDIIFCGKIIHGGGGDQDHQLNELQKRDYFATVESQSLRKPDRDAAEVRRLSASTRSGGEVEERNVHVRAGEVEAGDGAEGMKLRQRKLAAAAEMGTGKSKRRWGVVQSGLRGRSRLASVLARSLGGCIPVAGGGLERWVGVAN